MEAMNDLFRHNAALREELVRAVMEVVDSGWFVLGKSVVEFEKAFAEYCGVNECISVANGTDALELSLRAVGVLPGDEVITVANAGGYSTTAILAVGAVPRYADVDDGTLLMDVDALPAMIDACTKAIVVTHLYGQIAPMDRIMEIADAVGVPVIEDCAQAHGAVCYGRRAGAWGEVGCFSFYPTKNLGAIGDGGALVSSDEAIVARLRKLRQYGWGTKYHSVVSGGRNSRLDEIQAAVLNVKLPYLDGWNVQRREIATRYRQDIIHPGVRHPAVLDHRYVAHLYVVRALDRDSLKAHLVARNIPCDTHYPIPDYRQPIIADRYSQIRLPNTEKASTTVLTLPCFPEMTDSEVDEVISAVNSWGR